MYGLILLSFGVGVLCSTMYYFIKLFSLRRLLSKKDKELMACEKEITDITKLSHKLEIDNARLKIQTGEETDDEKSI